MFAILYNTLSSICVCECVSRIVTAAGRATKTRGASEPERRNRQGIKITRTPDYFLKFYSELNNSNYSVIPFKVIGYYQFFLFKLFMKTVRFYFTC